MEKESPMDVNEFYRKQIERMKQMGYTDREIEAQLDSMIRVTNMAMWATR